MVEHDARQRAPTEARERPGGVALERRIERRVAHELERAFSAHIRASCEARPRRVAALWNIAWNSVESIVGTLSWTHFWLNRCGTSKIATRRL